MSIGGLVKAGKNSISQHGNLKNKPTASVTMKQNLGAGKNERE